MERRKFSMFKFVGVFAATMLIFILGIQLGNYLTNIKLDKIDLLQNDMRIDILGLETQAFILNKNPCELSGLNIMADELYKTGEKLTFMESQLGKEDNSVKRLKNYYSILELRHWILLKEANSKCKTIQNLILYFYSNELTCSECETQGFVLDYIHNNKPSVKIYSFEYNLNNPAINTIKELYDINATDLPVLIINDKIYTGFKDKQEIESLLN